MVSQKSPKGRIAIKPKSAVLPNRPGVYFIVLKTDPKKVFYIGEARNLAQRIRYTFRCPKSNPSPCSRDYKLAYKTSPTCEDFCRKFSVKYLETSGMLGRLEIEERYQKHHKTNNKKFYTEIWQA